MNKHAQALGRIKTKKKARSSRRNGKLGGRPITRNTKEGELYRLVKPPKKLPTVSLKDNQKSLDKNQAIG